MSVQLYHGDCLEFMRTLPAGSVDAVVTDPPYGMGWDGRISRGPSDPRHGTSKNIPTRHFGVSIANDDRPFDPAPFLMFPRVVMFGYNHFSNRLPVGTALIWVKRYDSGFGSFLSDAEIAWMKGGHGVYCFRDLSLCGQSNDRNHPTEKPVSVMAWCLDMAGVPPGATVFDPFMGSGTTGVACVQTGRNFIGCEIDAGYFEIAQRRIALAQKQPMLPGINEPAPQPEQLSLV